MRGALRQQPDVFSFWLFAAQAAIEVPSAVQTPPKRVSTCILCFAGAGGAGRRCAGSPSRPLPHWGMLLTAYISTGTVRGVCTLQLAEAEQRGPHPKRRENDGSLTENTREPKALNWCQAPKGFSCRPAGPKALTGSRILRVGIIRVGIGNRQKALPVRPDGVMT